MYTFYFFYYKIGHSWIFHLILGNASEQNFSTIIHLKFLVKLVSKSEGCKYKSLGSVCKIASLRFSWISTAFLYSESKSVFNRSKEETHSVASFPIKSNLPDGPVLISQNES